MKTKALFLLLLLSLTSAIADIPVPSFSEFCPSTYCNNAGQIIDPTPPSGFFARQRWLYKKGWIEYWVKRKLQFDNEVSTCQETTSDKALCFMQIRQMESQKNANYNQLRLGTMQLQQQQAWESAQSYNMQQQAQAIRQIQSAPRNFNCQTYGNNTSCNGY